MSAELRSCACLSRAVNYARTHLFSKTKRWKTPRLPLSRGWETIPMPTAAGQRGQGFLTVLLSPWEAAERALLFRDADLHSPPRPCEYLKSANLSRLTQPVVTWTSTHTRNLIVLLLSGSFTFRLG